MSGNNFNKSIEVTTQYEKNDKDLRLCTITVPVNSETGETVLTVPTVEDRYIESGYGFFSEEIPMRAASIEGVTTSIVPADTFYPGQPELPEGYALKCYHDDSVQESMRGWSLPCKPDGTPLGILGIETMSGYGYIPAGLALKIVIKKPSPYTGYLTVNIKWAKKS